MRFLLRISLGLVFTAIILLGIVVAAMRLTMHNIQHFQSEIEYVLSGDETRRVTFSRVHGRFRGFNPILRIENASITLPDRAETMFISYLELEFDFWESLRLKAPLLLEMSGQLESMQIYRDSERRWWLNELQLGASAPQDYSRNFSQILALVPRYLVLDLNRLDLRDDVTGRTHALDRVNLRIDSRHDQLRLQLAAALPETLGKSILVKSSIAADRGLVYLSTTGLRVRPLLGLLDLEVPGLQQGTVEGEAWVNLEGPRLTSITGDVGLREGLLQAGEDRAVTELEYRSRFSLDNREDSWMVTNRVMKLRIDEVNLRPFSTQMQIGDADSPGRISAWFERVELSSLPLIAQQWLPPDINQQIRQSRLRGRVEDALLQIDPGNPRDYRVQARLVGVGSRRHGALPGVTNLDAEVVAVRDRVALKLAGQDVQLDFGDYFVEPLQFDRLAAEAVVQQFESGAVLSARRVEVSNADVMTWGRLWMKFDEADRPFAFIRAQFAEAQGSSTYKYLPVKKLPPRAYRWLEAGIKDGYVPRGDLQFHGRLRDLRKLTPQAAVEFVVDFDIERAHVFFRPGWLDARDGKGHVLFHNTSMLIDLEQVSYDSLRNARASAFIADFAKPELELDIRAEVPADEALEVWARTPVGERFRENIGNVDESSGQVVTAIDLHLPLVSGGKERTRVVLDLDDVGARSAAWGLELSRVNGRIEVLDGRLEARNIDARYFGDPVEVDVAQDKKADATVILASGTVASRNLLNALPDVWQQGITGKSDWKFRLAFDNRGGTPDTPFMHISARSELQGTRVRLPQPFVKAASQNRAVSADLGFYPGLTTLEAAYGGATRLRGRYVNHDGNYRMDTLDIAFSTALRETPGQGLNLYGYIPSVSVEDWVEFSGQAGETNPDYLQSADLSFDQVIVYNRLLDWVNLDIERDGDRFLGRIDSSLVRGDFEWPRKPSSAAPVVFEMDYLNLQKMEQEPGYSALTPAALTDFRFTSDSLVYHDMLFNDVRIDGRVVGETLQVDEFLMRRDQIQLSSSGIWEYDAETETHRSSFNVSVNGEKLGEAIEGLGFGKSLNGGSIDMQGGFTWPAPITSFDLENLVGDARLSISEGVLNNVEPGSGRFVGLLSLSALPRRLSLDFSDMLVEGMVFEKISGNYQMSGGNLFTEDTLLEGPAAAIKIAGRTGVVERDYDQTVKVLPQVSGVISLGALYTGNWALLLLQNLFQKAIDDAFEIEYKISGSWDDPQIDLVRAVDENQQDLPNFER